jgi:hypothetical protein
MGPARIPVKPFGQRDGVDSRVVSSGLQDS